MTWTTTPKEMEPDFIHTALLKELQKKLNDDFEKYSVVGAKTEHIESLRQSLANGSLAIVLGAGVSAGLGVPLWSGLISKLLTNLGVPDSDRADLVTAISTKWLGALALARYVETEAKYLPIFEHVLRQALYSDLKLGDYSNPTMRSIMNLCSSVNARVRRVLTYNFDDLLEIHAAKGDPPVPVRSICCDTDETASGNTNAALIYHVHGGLAVDPEVRFSGPLIFSERFYHHAYFDWSTFSNRIQLDTFAKFNCLFVGVSLSDPNMRRLLDAARRNSQRDHYVIFKSRFLSGGSSSTSEKFFDFVSERDAQHFGIRPIWISDHSEIPSILSKIRN